MTLEQLFATSLLSLSVPTCCVDFPPSDPPDPWLQLLASNTRERNQAFFGKLFPLLL